MYSLCGTSTGNRRWGLALALPDLLELVFAQDVNTRNVAVHVQYEQHNGAGRESAVQDDAVVHVVDAPARSEAQDVVVDLEQRKELLLAGQLTQLTIGRQLAESLSVTRGDDRSRQRQDPHPSTHRLTVTQCN